MYANILLSTDGSEVAKIGLKHGIALAKALNAKVTVITVTEPLLPVGLGYGPGKTRWMPSQEDLDSWDASRKEFAGKVLDEARVMAEQTGISAELLIVSNEHPATAIIETAKSRGCDLIVMSSHGHRAASISYFWGVKHRRSWLTEACRCWWCRGRRRDRVLGVRKETAVGL
jgi:nucleotide-binding universal stress UspA family protein